MISEEPSQITWIALLRGINVGGNNILPMAVLKEILTIAGCKNVQTYIQSGNIVFESATKSRRQLSGQIAALIMEHRGFEPKVFLLSERDLDAAMEENPFSEAGGEQKSLHFFFLEEPAKEANIQALESIQSPTESFSLTDRVFYLFAPDGVGRSKLASSAERYLGVSVTARNYRTIEKLSGMIPRNRVPATESKQITRRHS